MTNNTDEWWGLDGTSLHQYGWSVSTFGGSRYDLPPRRGDNIITAYRRGQVHRPKLPDQRTISLSMWLQGIDDVTVPNPVENDDGNLIGRREAINSTDDSNHRQRFNDSWDFLRRSVWKPNGSQVTLTRRWKLTSPYTGHNWGTGTPWTGLPATGANILTASAQAEMTSNMAPTMTGRHRGEFQMDFNLADPYFYGTQYTENVSNMDGAVTVWNDGHDTALDNVIVEFHGPLSYPRIVNTTTNPDSILYFDSNIGADVVMTVNVGAFTCLGSNGNNYIGLTRHVGSRHFFGLAPGANTLHMTTNNDSQLGYAVVKWRAPYV